MASNQVEIPNDMLAVVEDPNLTEDEQVIDSFVEGCVFNVDDEVDQEDIDNFVGGGEFVRNFKKRLVKYQLYPNASDIGLPAQTSTFLLYGLSGTGKSFLSRAIATYAKDTVKDCLFFRLSASDMIGLQPGQAEKCFRTLMQIVMGAARGNGTKCCILFLEGVDSLFDPSSTLLPGSRLLKIYLNFAREINTYRIVNLVAKNPIIIATSNRPSKVAPKLWKSFQLPVHCELPNIMTRAKLFHVYMRRHPSSFTDEDYDLFATRTNTYSGRDIKAVAEAAWEKAKDRAIDLRDAYMHLPPPLPRLDREVVFSAIEQIPSSITEQNLMDFEDFHVDLSFQ